MSERGGLGELSILPFNVTLWTFRLNLLQICNFVLVSVFSVGCYSDTHAVSSQCNKLALYALSLPEGMRPSLNVCVCVDELVNMTKSLSFLSPRHAPKV